jgi:hypothetical protein
MFLLSFALAAAEGGALRYDESAEHSKSTIKSPQDKKRHSLQKDRRNTYGENSKSSRKNIRKGKQRTHMEERRVANATLGTIKGNRDEDAVVAAELEARIRMIQS